MWLSYHYRLLTADNLAKRDIHITSSCIFCGVNLKTSTEIFFHCPHTLKIWASERGRLALFSWPSSISSLWGDWRFSNIPCDEANRCDCFVTVTIWMVWHERNQRIFQEKITSLRVLRVRFHHWWLNDAPIFFSTNVRRRHSLLFI